MNIITQELFSNDELKKSQLLIEEAVQRIMSLENDRANLEKVYKIIKYFTDK